MKDYEVKLLDEQCTGWKRKLVLEHEGKEYRASLYWDEFDGFELTWKDAQGWPTHCPDWASELDWHELDERTCEMWKVAK
jgi:hypothetical protein